MRHILWNFIIFIFTLKVQGKIELYVTDGPIERIGGRLYKKELLTDQFNSPKELAYDSSSRNLFFMYMDDVIQNSGRAVINTVTRQATKIQGIEKNKATAVDPETSEVYFGSENGLYKYDPLTNTANNIGLYNVNVMKIIIRNNKMYVIDGNNHMIYKIYNEGKRAVRVSDMKTVIEFNVDNQGNIHFVTMCGLFCETNGNIVKNTDLPFVYHFIVGDDKTYGVTDDGLFNINCVNGTAEKVADMHFVPKSIIFGDYGDVYYSEDDNIYRLRPVSAYLFYRHKKTT